MEKNREFEYCLYLYPTTQDGTINGLSRRVNLRIGYLLKGELVFDDGNFRVLDSLGTLELRPLAKIGQLEVDSDVFIKFLELFKDEFSKKEIDISEFRNDMSKFLSREWKSPLLMLRVLFMLLERHKFFSEEMGCIQLEILDRINRNLGLVFKGDGYEMIFQRRFS